MFGITGRKGRVGGLCKLEVKAPGSTWELQLILADWNAGEGGRIPCVAVKCVDIWRNTSGEGGLLA